MTAGQTSPIRARIPRTVWALGLVRIIDGFAESTAALSRVFSGYLSDKIGRRKPLMVNAAAAHAA